MTSRFLRELIPDPSRSRYSTMGVGRGGGLAGSWPRRPPPRIPATLLVACSKQGLDGLRYRPCGPTRSAPGYGTRGRRTTRHPLSGVSGVLHDPRGATLEPIHDRPAVTELRSDP